METKEQFIEFINKLPASQKEKEELLDVLENEGIEEVKVILRAALEESALKTSFKENVLQADNGLRDDMAKIEADATELRNEVSKELDAKQMDDLKKEIKG